MYHLFIIPAAKGGMAAAGAVSAHLAISHAALLYANHAVSTAGAGQLAGGHVAAGQALAGHAGRSLPAGHHPGIHPVSELIEEFAASAGATVAVLTFTNLYDHVLDELWGKAQDHLSAEDMREQMRHLAYVASRHTRNALRRIGKLSTEEASRLNQVRAQLLAMLQSMPLAGPAAAA